ncbi:MAG: DUF1080 domain-containing protein [Opitutus sp.]
MTPLRFPPLALLLAASAAFAAAPTPAGDPPPDQTPWLPKPQVTEFWSPEPPIVSAPAGGIPSDAIVLFDGRNLDAWESVKTPGTPASWAIEGDAMVVTPPSGHIQTKQGFGDVQLHIEFRTPAEVKGTSQGRGNSGVFFMGLYEVQILDSYDNKTYVNGQAGSIYKQFPPLVNVSRPPGTWQTYDIVFEAPRFGFGGIMRTPARVTVLHNGVLVQHAAELRGPTVFRGYPSYTPHADRLPLQLQDHRNPTAFRNIWIRELKLPE